MKRERSLHFLIDASASRQPDTTRSPERHSLKALYGAHALSCGALELERLLITGSSTASPPLPLAGRAWLSGRAVASPRAPVGMQAD